MRRIKFRSLSVAGEEEEVERVEMEGPVRTETKYEDDEEVLPDGTIHTLHKVRRHSIKHIKRSDRSISGEEKEEEEDQIIPGSRAEDVIETFDQPPKMIVSHEMIETTLPSGEKKMRKMTTSRMVHTVKTRHKSTTDGEEEDASEEEYEIDEVIPGTETCFLDCSDASDMEDDGPLEAVTPGGSSLLPPVLQRKGAQSKEEQSPDQQQNNNQSPASSDEGNW